MNTILRLQTPRTARLVHTGKLDQSTTFVWLCCHGYGMSVERFAEWFAPLPQGHVALCPEGLSRFYWGGFSGRPVASWMTSDERLHEIQDFCTWLDQVSAFAKTVAPNAQLILFGFSQGAATIMRWANDRRPDFHSLILWSGTPPEDIDYAPLAYYHKTKLYSRWGDQDELVPWQRAKQRYDEVALNFQHAGFAGKHRIPEGALIELVDLIVGG